VNKNPVGHRLEAVYGRLDPQASRRSLSIVTILLVVAFGLGGCSASQRYKLPPMAKLLPPERVHSKILKFAQPPEGRRLAACNGLVFVGQTWPAPGNEPTELDEVMLADGAQLYFDNRSGRKVADCSYWYCTRHSAECRAGCPPPEWTCDGINTGTPESEEEERLRAIGISTAPSSAKENPGD
jgi:hypothetical protein